MRVGVLLLAALLSAAPLPGAEPVPPADRAAALVAAMTAEERLSLVHGARDPEELGGAGYWPGLPRLHIPPLRFADGPSGINVNRDATALPAPVALAATFDRELAREYGAVLGREARALGQDVVLAPHINVVRDPLFRRNHTALSEDPFLTAELGAAVIEGIQSEGAIAQPKHLAAYHGENNAIVDEQALHELYLPPFEAALKAGAVSMMCAYNQVNGVPCCENDGLQNRILRGLWGFRGFVTSDWGAVRGASAITRGVDLEMPGREIAGRGGPFFREHLRAAVADGSIPMAVVDQAVARILRAMDRFHLLDPHPPDRPSGIDIERDAAVAERVATEGAVLLKNDAALPLHAEDLGSLALIGPAAGQIAAGFMGERGYGFEPRLVSPLTALRRLAPDARIEYSAGVDLTGVPIPPSLLSGYDAERVVDPGADYEWSGTLTVPTTGDYTLMVQAATGGGAEGGGSIALDGKVAVRSGGLGMGGSGMSSKKWSSLLPTTDNRDNARAEIHLERGPHAVRFSAQSAGERPLRIRFAWSTPELRDGQIRDAVRLASRARTPIVFAWRGSGPTLALPEDQDRLIEEVAAANPRAIVVLNSGGPVSMPWRDRVRAILEMWFPGQEGGWATARLLLGKAIPSGKLPVAFPEAGFAFGYGLSYTTFDYSEVRVTRTPEGAQVRFKARCTGTKGGIATPQVYAGERLSGFTRLDLAPGEARYVTLPISARSLSHWSAAKHGWVSAGDVPISLWRKSEGAAPSKITPSQ